MSDKIENYGAIEVRYDHDGLVDDVVAPWKATGDICVHAERMDDGFVWMSIRDEASSWNVNFGFHATKKGDLRWDISWVDADDAVLAARPASEEGL